MLENRADRTEEPSLRRRRRLPPEALRRSWNIRLQNRRSIPRRSWREEFVMPRTNVSWILLSLVRQVQSIPIKSEKWGRRELSLSKPSSMMRRREGTRNSWGLRWQMTGRCILASAKWPRRVSCVRSMRKTMILFRK